MNVTDFSELKSGRLIAEYSFADRYVFDKECKELVFGDVCDAVLYIAAGECRVSFGSGGRSIGEGDMICIPFGEYCRVGVLGSCDRCEVCAVFFHTYKKMGEYAVRSPFLSNVSISERTKKSTEGMIPFLFSELCRKDGGGEKNKLAASSVFFRLIEEIDTLSDSVDKSPHKEEISVGIAYIESNYLEEFSVEDVARKCGICISNFYKLFKQRTGLTPIEYKNRLKIERAVAMLKSHDYTVEEVSSALSFCNQSYFIRMFKKFTGHTPKKHMPDIEVK